MALAALRAGLVQAKNDPDPDVLRTRVAGLDFANPVGLPAGFDKSAVAVAGLARLGFGFVEVGTVTPNPQTGNPKPRLFRLSEDEAIINRLGFNNDGLTTVERRLRTRPRTPGVVVGANVGANRDSEDWMADYARGVSSLGPLVEFLVVNVSSPNTPGLRDLQQLDRLAELWAVVADARSNTDAPTVPIFLKIAPNLTEDGLNGIAAFALDAKVDGIVATNTTIERPETLRSPLRTESGGLSGTPLFDRSTAVVHTLYRGTAGRVPIIGVGGISSADQAFEKIIAGASLVQIYSGFIYRGPAMIPVLKEQLAERLVSEGFKNVGEAVGAGAQP